MKRGPFIFLITLLLVACTTHMLKSDFYISKVPEIKTNGLIKTVDTILPSINRQTIKISFSSIKNKYYLLPRNYRWIFNVAIFFCLVNVILFFAILFKRFEIDKNTKTKTKYSSKYRELLTFLIFTDREDKDDQLRNKYNDIFKYIRNEIKDPYKRELFRELLFTAHRNIKGRPSRKIMSLFIDFGYHEEANKRLKSKKWAKKIRGIRQLSRMHMTSYYKDFFELFNHKNIQVRREAGIGVGRLLEYNSLRYLKKVKHPISNWYQLELLDNISRFKSEKEPDLSGNLDSLNETVVVFTVKLLRYLNQVGSVDRLIKVLKTKNLQTNIQKHIRIEIIHTLYKWRVESIKEYLKELFAIEKDDDVKNEIFRYFERMANQTDVDFLINTLNEDAYINNLNAIKIIRKFDLNQQNKDRIFEILDTKKHAMANHFLNPQNKAI